MNNLEQRALKGSLWTFFGFGAAQALRLISNLIMTRFLAPEVFGLMGIIAIVTVGLAMFSDVGIMPALIQHPRRQEPAFLQTAWSIQILRGLFMCLGTCLLAWPVSLYYDEKSLVWMIPFAGLNAVVSGFDSVALATLNRSLSLGRITLIEITSQLSAIVVQIAWAWISPSIVALLVGGLIGVFTRTLLSHVALKDLNTNITHRWHIDPTAKKELLNFGKWIFASTAITFLLVQGDRFILSSLVPLGMLGLYYQAAQLSGAVTQVMGQLSGKVIFPLYAHYVTDLQQQSVQDDAIRLQSRIAWARSKLLIPFLIIPAFLFIFGNEIVAVLYSKTYAQAGWMLQLLSLGVMAQVIIATLDPIVLAHGKSFEHMKMLLIRSVLIIVGMLVGWFCFGGLKGLLLGLALAHALSFVPLVLAIRPYKIWKPQLDLALLIYAVLLVGIFYMLHKLSFNVGVNPEAIYAAKLHFKQWLSTVW